MDKMKMHSPDLSQDNIAKLREQFPGCVTEARDETTGELRLSVDFDQLRQELSEHIVEGPQERYRLDWPGKREALAVANAPIDKSLRPCREESVDFDTTQNLFIEGDNLEALKLLQEAYLGKVKMIYIDPPYNTGRDFVYADNFAESADEYLLASEQKDESHNQLVANLNSSGRFHSNWLKMMYPRLKLARNLLQDEGVIFISIDDGEQANVKKLCDEIFGNSNCIGEMMVIRAEGGGLAKQLIKGHDNLHVYAKNISFFKPLRRPRDIRGKTVSINGEDYWIEEDWLRKVFGKYGVCPYSKIEKYHGKKKKDEIDEGLKAGIYTLVKKKNMTIVGRYRKISEDGSKFYSILKHLNKNGIQDLESLKLDAFFDFPKPVSLVREILLGCTFFKQDKEAIILDFFAGSATTAHAMMGLNAEDGGSRKFIMVQIPEACDQNSEAFKAGYKNIAEISKERIRRAGKKILESACHESWNKDIGFRVLKVDTSNMANVYYRPDELKQPDLLEAMDSVKEGRSAEDLLFQVLVAWGVGLTYPIRRETIQERIVFFVDGNALIACFDSDVTEELVKEMARHKPLRAIFRDNGFASDDVKINVEQIFRQLSPSTEVKSI